MTSQHGPWLERIAIEVSDLDRWARMFEGLLGPGFERHVVKQASGPVEIAIHPAGIELVQGPTDGAVRLRSFHLGTTDLAWATGVVQALGWKHLDGIALNGRRHEVIDADGLRMLLVERPDPES